MTTVLTTHNLEEAQLLCSNVLILHHGEIVLDRSIEDAIQSLEEKFYSVSFESIITQKQLHGFSSYHAEMREDGKASFCIRSDQDIGHLIYKLHLAGHKITHVAPSSHQLEQLLHQATL
jgi:ABC-2 type transport system ATP-binding protein